jgi:hypothetical protein
MYTFLLFHPCAMSHPSHPPWFAVFGNFRGRFLSGEVSNKWHKFLFVCVFSF